MTKKIESKRHHRGGLEETLDFAATALLLLGIIFAIASLVWLNIFGVVEAFSILVNAIVIWLSARATAEIIRLLIKQTGLPYAGSISSPDTYNRLQLRRLWCDAPLSHALRFLWCKC